MKRSGILLTAALALLLCAMALKGWLVQLPEPAPASASRFSAERAMARLAYILGDQRPHPVDSDENDAVRARLIEQMRAVGLDPQVTDDFACNSHRAVAGVSCARVRNVVATIGPKEGRHVLAVAHYDSTPMGPGAADDGIGVAALLEVAHRLRGQPLRRPVTFLIDDGEEGGLLGARAFMERHPIAGRIEALVNLEARGVEGPAIMFETSQPNGTALATYARTTERPVANSLTADFYRLVPNSTDVTVFKERGWTTLNYAIIENETRYHTAGDTLDALSPRSLQHMGDGALSAIRGFANGEPAGARGQRHYTDILGRTLIVLPASVSLALLGLAVLLLAWTGWRRRGKFGAVSAIVGAILASTALVWLGQFLVGLFRSGQWWRGHPEIISLALAASALLACAAALVLSRSVTRERLRAAFWLVFALLGALACIAAPGASILVIGPPLVAAVGMQLGGNWERIFGLAAAALLFLLFGPLLHAIEVLLGYGSAWMFAPLAALILFPWLIELQPLMASVRRPRARNRGRRGAARLGRGGGGPCLHRGPATAIQHRICLERRKERGTVGGGERPGALARQLLGSRALDEERGRVGDSAALDRAGTQAPCGSAARHRAPAARSPGGPPGDLPPVQRRRALGRASGPVRSRPAFRAQRQLHAAGRAGQEGRQVHYRLFGAELRRSGVRHRACQPSSG
jgi:hypothetical protein